MPVGFDHNFQRRGDAAFNPFNYPYDENSITHFDGYDFSSNHFPTLLNKNGRYAIVAQRNWLSKIDQAKINEMYCAKKKIGKENGSCSTCTGK